MGTSTQHPLNSQTSKTLGNQELMIRSSGSVTGTERKRTFAKEEKDALDMTQPRSSIQSRAEVWLQQRMQIVDRAETYTREMQGEKKLGGKRLGAK